MIKAVGYIRVSTEEQAREGWSLSAQREKVEMYSKLQDMELVEIICDEGISACNVKGRPGMMRLLDMTATGKRSNVQAIVTVKLDRLFRNAAEALKYSEMWRKRGVELHSISEGIQTGGASGKMFFSLLAVFAEFERDQASERTKAGLARRKSEGLKLGGLVQYGFKADENGLMTQDENEQKVIRVMEKLRTKGLSLKKISEHLNGAGFTTRKGTAWKPEYIHYILKLPD